MGLANKASGLLNKGVVAVGRVSRQQTLKAEIRTLEEKREELYRALGEKVFKERPENPEVHPSLKPLFASIENATAQIQLLKIDFSVLTEQQPTEEAGRDITNRCGKCGKPIAPSQDFCVFCGERNSPMEPLFSENICQRCGSALVDGQKFCMGCGNKVG